MPKMKSHRATKKVFNKRPGGTVTMGCPGSRHNTGKKNADVNRKKRSGSLLSRADRRRLKSLI